MSQSAQRKNTKTPKIKKQKSARSQAKMWVGFFQNGTTSALHVVVAPLYAVNQNIPKSQSVAVLCAPVRIWSAFNVVPFITQFDEMMMI